MHHQLQVARAQAMMEDQLPHQLPVYAQQVSTNFFMAHPVPLPKGWWENQLPQSTRTKTGSFVLYCQ